MDRVMRIGTRRSALALAQARIFIESCRAASPDADLCYEIVEMSTSGDRILDKPLYAFAGKGMFISAFEKALAAGEIDAAVHSGKDMPVEIPEGLAVCAVLPRANPRDVLVTLPGKELTADSVIGTGSLRRQEQVKRYLGCRTKGIRGNVNTRLHKLLAGEADGLILAAAGLERLSLLPSGGAGRDGVSGWQGGACRQGEFVCEDKRFCYRELDERDFLPAAAQGIIAVESRADSPFMEIFRQVNDRETMDCFLAERAFLAGIGAGCQQPVAAYARCRDGRIYLDAARWEDGRLYRLSGEESARRGGRLAAELAGKMTPAKGAGHVCLVGAGPGGRDLITVKGLELLRSCDVLVYDRLCGEELLSEASPSCERIYVGKRAGYHSMRQDEISDILIQKAREGKRVVRLKGGDPFVFGRGGEEAERLLAEHIPFTLVPGVTSAVAVPELAGIPVTHREVSRSFHVITAHTADTDPGAVRAYLQGQIESLKDAEGTFVFLMGLRYIDTICELLQQCGKRPDLPAAVIGSGGRYDEKAVRGTLADIGRRAREEALSSPAVIVAGETAALTLKAAEKLPLSGMRVGVTGTRELTDKLGKRLREAGAEALRIQELTIRPLEGQGQYFAELSVYTWIVFTSAGGAGMFFAQMRERGLDVRGLHGIRFAVIGKGTAECLIRYGIFPDLMPDTYTARALALSLAGRLDRDRDRVLLYQAREGNPVIEETLREAGIEVTRAEAYTTEAEMTAGMEVLGTLSYLTFASGSAVRAFVGKYPHIFAEETMRHVRFAAIGEVTARALAAAGCENCLTAAEYTADGLAAAIIEDAEKQHTERTGEGR